MYLLLFYEFAKIGLFAVGGGLVTIPFLFELGTRYGWFSSAELVDMVAIAESSPGPVGINMATYVGFKTAGIWGGIVATAGIILPSVVIIVIIARLLDKYQESSFFQNLMFTIRPAVIALILNAGLELGLMALIDVKSIVICAIFWGAIHFLKLHPIVYIILGGILGVIMRL